MTRLERVTGIEPVRSAWEADRLPLHHTRSRKTPKNREKLGYACELLGVTEALKGGNFRDFDAF